MQMHFIKKPFAIGIGIALLVTTLISTGLYFYHKHSGNDLQRPESVKIEVDLIRRGSITRSLTVVGTLAASNTVTMKAQVRGLISKVYVQGGEEVSKGDLLFEVDDRSFKAQLKEAQALLALTEAEFNRAKQLSDKNFGAIKNLDKARAEYLRAQAQVEKAQKDLDDSKIIAPFEGIVSLHKISEGTPISNDLDLLTITDIDPIKVDFKVPAKYIPYLSLGQKLKLEVDSYPGKKFEGTIEGIDALVDASVQSIAIKGTLENPKGLLKPGMFVRVNLTVGSKDNSLIAPEEAVVEAGDQTFVWKVIEHPNHPGLYVVFRVPIITGLQENDRVEIKRGLFEDDIVVTVGYHKVSDGVPVRFDLSSVGLDKKESSQTPVKSPEGLKKHKKSETKKEEVSNEPPRREQVKEEGEKLAVAKPEVSSQKTKQPGPKTSFSFGDFIEKIKTKITSLFKKDKKS